MCLLIRSKHSVHIFNDYACLGQRRLAAYTQLPSWLAPLRLHYALPASDPCRAWRRCSMRIAASEQPMTMNDTAVVRVPSA